MNLKRYRLPRVSDLQKQDQTDKLKKELYDMILPFVRKYQPLYYRQYKGDLEDLASDFFIEFMTPKSRIEGKEQTLLDKFDPSITTLPYLVKQSVIRMLIDRARTDKGEVNYTETYDEDTEELSLDFLRGDLTQEEIVQIEDIEFDKDFLDSLVSNYNKLSDKEKRDFLEYYNEVKSVLSPNFRDLFERAALDKPFKGSVIKIEGKAPEFKVIRNTGGKTSEEIVRARNIESLRKKLMSMYPGVRIEDCKNVMKFPSRRISDSCRRFFSDDFLIKHDKEYELKGN